MNTVGHLLEVKGREICSVSPQESVYNALEIMAEKSIGALLVIDEAKLIGIFSERDYARRIILKGKASRDTKVEEVMTREVISVSPENSIADCMLIMANNRIRHLPVLEDDRLVGIVTIGDVVKQIISNQAFTIKELEKYLTTAG